MEKINYLNDVMFFLLGSITMSIILSQISLYVAPFLGLMDIPGSENHKSHSKSIPITGGIVLIITITTVVMFGNLWDNGPIADILVCVLIIGSFGVADDLLSLSPLLKLLGQLIASTLLIYYGIQVNIFSSSDFILSTGTIFDEILNLVCSVFWLVTITNAFNFIDSSDGLSIGIGGVASIFFLFISITTDQILIVHICTLLLGVCIGLYFYNAFPARLFLGDCGSQSVGFILASIAMLYKPVTGIQSSSWFVPILLFYIPLIDITLVIYSRLRRGKKIYKASKDHTYHRLINIGISPQRSVLILHGLSLIMSIVGYLCLNLSVANANFIFILSIALGIFLIYKLDNNYV